VSDAIGDAKRELRSRMRAVRGAVDDVEMRSARLWACVQDEPAVRTAQVVLVFASIPGEPATAPFVEWCRRRGKTVVIPEAMPSAPLPVDPSSLDVVVVPGLAFTNRGDRLGQGGGWFDRLLTQVRPDCTTIGVCFDVQLVPEIPIGDHDVRVGIVITETGRVTAADE
jgi:5-formyltetrahydrofolate cyclo-ligase